MLAREQASVPAAVTGMPRSVAPCCFGCHTIGTAAVLLVGVVVEELLVLVIEEGTQVYMPLPQFRLQLGNFGFI
jgi:hypothetical protein